MSGRPIKLGLLAAAPVHYQAPLYRRLAADPRLDFTAIFASTAGVRPFDGGYGRPVDWDVDLTGGYRSRFLGRAEVNSTGGRFLALRDLDVVTEVIRGGYEVLWLHGYYSATHLLAAAAQKLRRAPLLLREEQTLLHRRPAWKEVPRALLLRGLLARTGALCIGTENRRWFGRYGVPPERMFSVPYCVDNDRLRDAAETLRESRDSLRRSFGIDDDAPVFLTVSRLMAKKQPLAVLEAFRHVRAGRRCWLLVVGSGDLEAEMRRAVRRAGIPDVRFAGFLNQSELPSAYACADVFVLFSHETWGLVVNEAMNFGLPIVVSDKVGSAPDLVVDGGNGFIVDAADPDALAQALARLADDARMRDRLGARSLDRIGAFTYERAAAGIAEAVAASVGAERWRAAAGASTPSLAEVRA